VDCPAGASHGATLPFRYSDGTVVVTKDTRQALEDAAKTAALARRLGAPPQVVLVRGETDVTGDVERPAAEDVACPVKRVPTIEADDVHAHPRFRGICEQVVRLAVDGRVRRRDRPRRPVTPGTAGSPRKAENFNRW